MQINIVLHLWLLFLVVPVTGYGQSDIDTISVTLTKPVWLGTLPKPVSLQLTTTGGMIASTRVPRRTGIFGESHKVVLRNGKIGYEKETSYTIKAPDLLSNVKISANIYKSPGEFNPEINVIDNELDIELVGIVKESMPHCLRTGDNVAIKNFCAHLFTWEVVSVQTIYKPFSPPEKKPAVRHEVFMPSIVRAKDRVTRFVDLGGDLSSAHLHYLLHSLFIGGGGNIPIAPRSPSTIGYNIDAERHSRVIDGSEVENHQVDRRTVDDIMRFLNSEADNKWYDGMAEDAVFLPGTRTPKDKYQDDLLSTNCNAKILRVNVSSAQVSHCPGLIISLPELEYDLIIIDNSYGEEVGDENKVDTGLGSRLCRLTSRRRSSSLGDLPNLPFHRYKTPRSTEGRSAAHIYEPVDYDVPRSKHSSSDTEISYWIEPTCRPGDDSPQFRRDDDDHHEYGKPAPRLRPILFGNPSLESLL